MVTDCGNSYNGPSYDVNYNIIGASSWPGSVVDGLIDEVAIFNRALTAEEIAAIYNAGSAGKCKPCFAPPTGMVSWWRAQDNANDSIGTNHGTLMNGTTFAAGKVGQAFSFDGVDDWVEVTGDVGDFGNNPFTVEFWMYSNNNGNSTYIMGKSHPDGGLGWDIRLHNQKIRLEGIDGWHPQYNWQSNTSISSNTWHHIALSATTGSISIYINGVLDGTTSRSSISSTSNPFRIGFTTNYGGTAFTGLIDEVSIFNRALTAEEIAAIYNAGSAGKCDIEQYTLTVAKAGTGTGTVTSNPAGINCGGTCNAVFADGTSVTLTATPATDSTFVGWSGDSDCSDGVVTMDSDKSCTATFTLNQYTITATANPSAGGSITCTPNPVNHGSSSTCTITPNTGYTLQNVTGTCGGTLNGNTYTTNQITSDCTVVANFSLVTSVTISAATGNGNITLQTSSPNCGFYNVSAKTEAQIGNDPNYDYPYGLVEFSLNCSNATVTITFPGNVPSTYRKYGPTTPGNPSTTQWYTFSNATINGNQVTLTLQDGQLGDDTGVDGIIIDQGGPGQPGQQPQAVAVPTMTEWGMVIFMALAGLGSIYYLRRKRA